MHKLVYKKFSFPNHTFMPHTMYVYVYSIYVCMWVVKNLYKLITAIKIIIL